MVPIEPTYIADMVDLYERTLASFFLVEIQTHTFLFCLGVVIALVMAIVVFVAVEVTIIITYL